MAAGPVSASILLTPAAGAADNATLGTRAADPHDPAAALFANPAGLVEFDTTTMTMSIGAGFGNQEVEAFVPEGYNESHKPIAAIPAFGVAFARGYRWRFGVGAYGYSGATFDADADADLGVERFFSETAIAAVPVGVAYRVSDHLSLGAQVCGLFGQLRSRFTLGGLDFRYKLNGPGLQGMVGATLRPNDRWAVGLSIMTPGKIWMDGSMPVPGVGRQNIEVDLKMPTQVLFGVTHHLADRLTLSSSLRFTDASSFGDSTIRYQFTPQANNGFIPDSQDEWRAAFGMEYGWSDALDLRAGVAWSSRIVGSEGVSPLVFDGDDTKVAIGSGYRFGAWTLDFMAGYAFPSERRVGEDKALILPGRYKIRAAVVILGITHRY